MESCLCARQGQCHGHVICAGTLALILRRALIWVNAVLSPLWNSWKFLNKETPIFICIGPTNDVANPSTKHYVYKESLSCNLYF